MARGWEALLRRWREAGLIDAETTAAIEGWEQAQGGSKRLTLPVQVALFVGGLLLAAGLLLFVSAHWANLGPGQRFALVLSVLLGLHAAAAAVQPQFGRLGLTLHGVAPWAAGATAPPTSARKTTTPSSTSSGSRAPGSSRKPKARRF